MNLFLAAIGIFFIAFAVWGLLRPPKKHKDFSYKDQREATQRGLGGGAPFPDPDDVIPPEMKK